MSARIRITDTPLPGLKLLHHQPLDDERGYLERLYCDDELQPALADRRIRQINRTLTRKTGVVRGMHYQQPPYAECKLVSCLHGAVFDVAVDLRSGSPTFLRWYGLTLSGNNGLSFMIPEGFAHGFQTLDEDCEMLYFHTAPYNAEAEDGVNACDPRLDIRWPLPIAERSNRDENHLLTGADYRGIAL